MEIITLLATKNSSPNWTTRCYYATTLCCILCEDYLLQELSNCWRSFRWAVISKHDITRHSWLESYSSSNCKIGIWVLLFSKQVILLKETCLSNGYYVRVNYVALQTCAFEAFYVEVLFLKSHRLSFAGLVAGSTVNFPCKGKKTDCST